MVSITDVAVAADLGSAKVYVTALGDADEKKETVKGLKAAAPFSRRVRDALPDIGTVRRASGEKARTVLGWAPRSREEAVLATVDTLPTYHPRRR